MLERKTGGAAGDCRRRRPRELERLALALAAHDPQRTLERGYALVESPAGEPIASAAAGAAAGGGATAFADGSVAARGSRGIVSEADSRAQVRTYEASAARVEEIIRRLDAGEASLSETLELVREGKDLIEHCARELEAVGDALEELRLEDLVARLEARALAAGTRRARATSAGARDAARALPRARRGERASDTWAAWRTCRWRSRATRSNR